MMYLFLIIGFIVLIKGADIFVDGASDIAKRFKIPHIIVGLTIVAFGTSAPEAAVSITASLNGQNDIAIGNIVGSNIFNLLGVIGIVSMISPIKVTKNIIIKEFPFAILASFVLIILSHDTKFQTYPNNELTRGDGFILLSLFLIFLYYLFEMAIISKDTTKNETDEEKPNLIKSIVFSIIGITAVVFGGDMVVDNASSIATSLGLSESLTGLTIVAIGTSLPELVTSVTAAKKGESDIAIGNVLGSNLFNIFFILGISSSIHTISIQSVAFIDMIIMLIVTILAYIFAFSKTTINKFEGAILTTSYIIYTIYIIYR